MCPDSGGNITTDTRLFQSIRHFFVIFYYLVLWISVTEPTPLCEPMKKINNI